MLKAASLLEQQNNKKRDFGTLLRDYEEKRKASFLQKRCIKKLRLSGTLQESSEINTRVATPQKMLHNDQYDWAFVQSNEVDDGSVVSTDFPAGEFNDSPNFPSRNTIESISESEVSGGFVGIETPAKAPMMEVKRQETFPGGPKPEKLLVTAFQEVPPCDSVEASPSSSLSHDAPKNFPDTLDLSRYEEEVALTPQEKESFIHLWNESETEEHDSNIVAKPVIVATDHTITSSCIDPVSKFLWRGTLLWTPLVELSILSYLFLGIVDHFAGQKISVDYFLESFCPLTHHVRRGIFHVDTVLYGAMKYTIHDWCDAEDSMMKFFGDVYVRGLVTSSDSIDYLVGEIPPTAITMLVYASILCTLTIPYALILSILEVGTLKCIPCAGHCGELIGSIASTCLLPLSSIHFLCRKSWIGLLMLTESRVENFKPVDDEEETQEEIGLKVGHVFRMIVRRSICRIVNVFLSSFFLAVSLRGVLMASWGTEYIKEFAHSIGLSTDATTVMGFSASPGGFWKGEDSTIKQCILETYERLDCLLETLPERMRGSILLILTLCAVFPGLWVPSVKRHFIS